MGYSVRPKPSECLHFWKQSPTPGQSQDTALGAGGDTPRVTPWCHAGLSHAWVQQVSAIPTWCCSPDGADGDVQGCAHMRIEMCEDGDTQGRGCVEMGRCGNGGVQG